MFTFILVLHLIAVCCWLGGALYERCFIVAGFHREAGSEKEVPMLKLLLGSVPFFFTSVVTIIVTGIAMTIMGKYGFLQWSWIGLKQYIMLGIIILLATIIAPGMKRLKKRLKENIERGGGVDDLMRSQTNRLIVYLDIMHVGVLVNLILGVTKFF
ncbi:hypothetical protein [Sporosarcina highlanderae]|uniref:Copper resistance protein D domain-containing protein n=1 Tax=Sporosarcina highlanderae TaxID=3035916 RepID=A0ABT8JNN6_9BACL|nr:hypothetical protein [Sporosarcina highlanderae]MDN4606694.1 hypothetical protein [Sporosarcina highlanderae]